ncbi:MAG: hypothetical protein AAGN82_14735 [Myxococcota bacterium]
MNRKHRVRWILFAALGATLALLIGFLALPMALPTPKAIRVVQMNDYTPANRQAFGHEPPPEPVAQPLLVIDELSPEVEAAFTQAQDRADWIDGAVVTCDVSAIFPGYGQAFVDMDQGVNLDGQVDVVSRFNTPVMDGRVTLAVTEPSGTARLSLPDMMRHDDDDDEDVLVDGNGAFNLGNTTIRVRWSGAQPGSTVACDGAWEQPQGQVEVELVSLTLLLNPLERHGGGLEGVIVCDEHAPDRRALCSKRTRAIVARLSRRGRVTEAETAARRGRAEAAGAAEREEVIQTGATTRDERRACGGGETWWA